MRRPVITPFVVLCILAFVGRVVGSADAGAPAPNPCEHCTSKTPQRFEQTWTDGRRMEYWCAEKHHVRTTTIWSKTEQKLYEYGYDDAGRSHGTSRTWYEDGMLKEERIYDHGVDRLRLLWHPNGKRWSYALFDVRGVSIYHVSFDENGRTLQESGLRPVDLPADVAALAGTADPIPRSIIERADAYIVGKVGRPYFEANYRILLRRSYYARHKDIVEYFLYFEYAPAARLGVAQPVFVRMFDQPDFVPYDTVAMFENGSVVEPKLTFDEALAIVKSRSTTSLVDYQPHGQLSLRSFRNDAKYQKWSWRIYFIPTKGPISDTGGPFADVNAVSGSVTGNIAIKQ